jgi:uncharacterized protein (DUF924 family)
MEQELIDFWFSDEVSKLWYNATPDFDRLLRERYLDLWQQASRGELDHWGESALGSLALVILLDQFPLNMFRGSAQSYSSEARSREVARAAIDRGFDGELPAGQCSFLYMPFMHSEDIEDQRLAIKLFSQPGLESNLRFAKHHHDIVDKFGRFPHRNDALGRDNSDAEIEYLNSKQAFKG